MSNSSGSAAPAPSIRAIFPSDQFVVLDHTTRTGLRISLPDSEDLCSDPDVAVCSAQNLLNTLDGFSVNPRVMVCFSAPVDPQQAAASIVLVPVRAPFTLIPLNQVILNPERTCLFGKPNQVLEQRSSYLIVVQRIGANVRTAPAELQSFLWKNASEPALAPLLHRFAAALSSVAGVSLFTTMSATSWLQDAYQYAVLHQPPVAAPAGIRSTFSIADLQSITYNAAQSGLQPQSIPLTPALDHVGQVAFGFFFAPNYLNLAGPAAGSITTAATNPIPVPGVPAGLPPGYIPISFHVFLPDSPPPAGGYPVIVSGHGLGDTQFGASTYMASTYAANGFATVAFEITGHGFGQNSHISIADKAGQTYNVSTPGRGILLPGASQIGASDGCILPGPLAVRDCGRQTAVDLFALVKTIERTNGLSLHLNANSLFYVGQSFGAIYGSLFHAVAPDVKTAVLNAGGGPFVDVARLAVSGRPLAAAYVCGLGLANVVQAPADAIAACGPAGFRSEPTAMPQPYFHDVLNDNYPYRNRKPLVNDVPGALQIQAAFEAAEWLGMLGDPIAFAPHFKRLPLPGNPVKATLFQASIGDLEVPNPANQALLRAAGETESSLIFNFPQAVSIDPFLAGIQDPAVPFPILPHRILGNPTIFSSQPGEMSEKILSLAEQQTVAAWFKSNGQVVPVPNTFLEGEFLGVPLFQKTAELPFGLNFVQIAP